MIPDTLQVTQTQPWMRWALCAEDPDPDFWFPDPDDDAEIRQLKTAEAIRVCKHCPVRGECLRWAFETGDEWAILGATTKGMRTRTRRRMAHKKLMEKS
jgi:WhiB family redox-sensing transcriptional regulator